jgi:hypothetical protein
MRSDSGVRFDQTERHAVRAHEPVTPSDDYHLIAHTDATVIRALRLEALPLRGLPFGGPGLAANGNFVLTGIQVTAAPRDEPARRTALRLGSPHATFAQGGFGIDRTVDRDDRTGWAVQGNLGRESSAMWLLEEPFTAPSGCELRVTLQHRSGQEKHLLGHFRLSVTAEEAPRLVVRDLPAAVAQALSVDASRRSKKLRDEVLAYFRERAASLQPRRAAIAELQALQLPFPPRVARSLKTEVAVHVERRGFAGPVRVALAGWSSGRDANGVFNGIDKSFGTAPVTLAPHESIARLQLEAKNDLAPATGWVVAIARATGPDGGEWVQVSAPFPVTVE